MKEIVTVQVGSYANFVGSHFWNFQDELLGLADSPESDQVFKSHGLNMDALYRTGETQQVDLFCNPTVTVAFLRTHLDWFQWVFKILMHAFESIGSLGSMNSRGTVYNEVTDTSVDSLTWTGPVTTLASQPLKKNIFLQSLYVEENMDVGSSKACDNGNSDTHNEVQDKEIIDCLENEVQYWTDFSKVHYHPQSLYELCGLWTDINDFNNYGSGKEAFSGGLHAEEINERLRFFVEESDHPQGIQFIVDDSGGFSGVAGEFLENIADEYASHPVLLYSVHSPDSCLGSRNNKRTVSRKLHDAVSFSKLSEFCKLIVPLGLPSLNTSKLSKYLYLEDEKPYHTSAIYASAIHSMSLPFRMEPLGPSAPLGYTSGAVTINELVQMLSGQARQNMVTILDVSMPASALTGSQFQQSLLEALQPLNPEIADDVEDVQALESMIVHGAFASGCKRASVSEVQDAVQAAYLNSANRPKFSHLSVAQCPLPIPLPFPSMFRNLVGQHGELSVTPVSSSSATRGSLEVHSIPMAAGLRSTIAILPFLENSLGNLRKLGIARGALGTPLLENWGFGREDVEDMGEKLSNMVTTLSPPSLESSDSD